MSVKDTITGYMGARLKGIFQSIPEAFLEEAEEIRIRADRPLIIRSGGREYLPNGEGIFVSATTAAETVTATRQDIAQIIELLSNYSLYAFENELRNGYITIPGGHRVGLTGKVVQGEFGIVTMKHINGLNIRIAHQIPGCATKIIDHIFNEGSLLNTMIISPPGSGKTTLLRDMVRQISDGEPGKFSGRAVGLVDERSEIAGCYMGVPQNDVGKRTDVLDGCRKHDGMLMLLRSMSPEVIAVDEIGKHSDVMAIEDILNSGVKIICTLHGSSLEEVRSNPSLRGVFSQKAFKRFIVLRSRGAIGGIYDENANILMKGAGNGDDG